MYVCGEVLNSIVFKYCDPFIFTGKGCQRSFGEVPYLAKRDRCLSLHGNFLCHFQSMRCRYSCCSRWMGFSSTNLEDNGNNSIYYRNHLHTLVWNLFVGCLQIHEGSRDSFTLWRYCVWRCLFRMGLLWSNVH